MPSPLVSVGIVTWNSGADIEACLAAVRAQTHAAIELLVGDNASADATRECLRTLTTSGERVFFDENRGFSAAHNALIARSRGDFYLCLNPDVVLDAGFVEILAGEMGSRPRVGSATGTLLRRDPPHLVDSTGIVMTPNQRHLDRGAGEPDNRARLAVEPVFGASGAAAFYRRAMLDDIRVGGEYFDEDFFAYREDADLAWRAQLLGWSCIHVPAARASHGRRVTPERRGGLPPELNRYSVRNRFLLRLKNQPAGHLARFLVPALVRDLQVVGYVLLKERTSLPGLFDVLRLLPRTWRKRRDIMRRRTISSADLARWFSGPAAR